MLAKRTVTPNTTTRMSADVSRRSACKHEAAKAITWSVAQTRLRTKKLREWGMSLSPVT